MRKIIAILFVFFFFSKAQSHMLFMIPEERWWDRPKISKELQLTKEEKKKLKEVTLKARMKLIEKKAALKKERLKLISMIESKDATEEQINRQFELLQKAREDLLRTRFEYILEIRKILGVERFNLLKEFFAKKARKRMRKRHGKKGPS